MIQGNICSQTLQLEINRHKEIYTIKHYKWTNYISCHHVHCSRQGHFYNNNRPLVVTAQIQEIHQIPGYKLTAFIITNRAQSYQIHQISGTKNMASLKEYLIHLVTFES